MVKLWSKNKTIPLRTLARIPVLNKLDTFELEIKFEAWVKNFPHVAEIYDQGALDIVLQEQKLIVRARMTDRQYMMWCLKHGGKLNGYLNKHH